MVGTFKIVTLASAIEEKKVNIFEDTFYDSGSVKVSGATLHCWKRKGHGQETFLQVVENSCNPGFVELGLKLGKDKLFEYINKLGFGKKTGIDLNGEATGILFNKNKIGALELATTAFGQGVSVTAIQQVASLSAIINGGTYYKPFIVSKYGNTKKDITVLKENIISKNTSDLVKYALESVVANGSGRNAYIENYRVGGKTGTAQKVGSNGQYMDGNYILSFIGFMPADKPEYVIYIALDHPTGVTQYGGVASAPIASSILKQIINIYNLKEDKNGIPKSYKWDDTKYITVPDVIGMDKNKATRKLKALGFNVLYTGIGETVIDTSIDANARIKEGSYINLMLN